MPGMSTGPSMACTSPARTVTRSSWPTTRASRFCTWPLRFGQPCAQVPLAGAARSAGPFADGERMIILKGLGLFNLPPRIRDHTLVHLSRLIMAPDLEALERQHMSADGFI